MKKICTLFFVTALIITEKSFAQTEVENDQTQIEEGTWVVGGSSNLGFLSTNDNATSFSFELNPGSFVAENIAIGIGLSINNQTIGDDDKTQVTTIGPWTRYYINGAFFIGASLSAVKVKNEFQRSIFESTGSVLGLEVGYAHFLNNYVAIEPVFNYLKGGGDFNNTTLGLTIGLSVYF